ncbi:hypothetical protein L1887_05469 [Cichorium endivia]|nr:hypothetical protein L1887_05469 [Cichorium endivia]
MSSSPPPSFLSEYCDSSSEEKEITSSNSSRVDSPTADRRRRLRQVRRRHLQQLRRRLAHSSHRRPGSIGMLLSRSEVYTPNLVSQLDKKGNLNCLLLQEVLGGTNASPMVLKPCPLKFDQCKPVKELIHSRSSEKRSSNGRAFLSKVSESHVTVKKSYVTSSMLKGPTSKMTICLIIILATSALDDN